MNNMGGTLGTIYIAITICIVVAVILLAIVLFIWWQNNKKKNGEKTIKDSLTKSGTGSTRLDGIESMSKFLAFDEVVNNMIVRKNGEEYVMVIQCKGVNYDLLGEDEKLAIEEGFMQFLNILRFPIQLYVQTRRLNLNSNIEKYNTRIDQIKDEISKINLQIKKEEANGREQLVRKLNMEKRRKENILEYGTDVTNYIARMSQNKNVLQQNTYVVLSYYKAEFGGEAQNYSKEEIDGIAFSELYTRAQTLIRGLGSAGVSGKVLDSEELAELLYVAYNRDDSEIINIRRCVEAEYDSLYNTAKDVLEKQKEIIEKTIDEEAINLTARSIRRADKIRKLRKERGNEIKQRALNYVEAYRYDMSDELYKETKKQVEKADLLSTKKKKRTSSTSKEIKKEHTTKAANSSKLKN